MKINTVHKINEDTYLVNASYSVSFYMDGILSESIDELYGDDADQSFNKDYNKSLIEKSKEIDELENNIDKYKSEVINN